MCLLVYYKCKWSTVHTMPHGNDSPLKLSHRPFTGGLTHNIMWQTPSLQTVTPILSLLLCMIRVNKQKNIFNPETECSTDTNRLKRFKRRAITIRQQQRTPSYLQNELTEKNRNIIKRSKFNATFCNLTHSHITK